MTRMDKLWEIWGLFDDEEKPSVLSELYFDMTSLQKDEFLKQTNNN